jgi:hypothetical protein
MLSSSIMKSDDLMKNANATNHFVTRTNWVKPKYVDDGAVHNYTVNWHPNYIELLSDGKRIEFQAFNKFVPDEWLKLTFIARPTLDKTNPNVDDSSFWVGGMSYDADWSKLKKIVSDGKGGYNLV